MKTGKNTGIQVNATSATKACIKTSISTRWRFMILIQENTAAKATEDATTRQQTTDTHHEKLENQKMKLTNGSQTPRKHACSAHIRCLYQTSKIL